MYSLTTEKMSNQVMQGLIWTAFYLQIYDASDWFVFQTHFSKLSCII